MPGLRLARPLLVLVSLSLAACGFRLAGTASLPPELESIQLVTRDLSAAQRERLVARLESAGARVSGEADAAAVRLAVSLESLPARRVVSGAGGGKNVDRVSQRLVFSLWRNDGRPLSSPRALVQYRDLAVDDDNLLASEEERSSLRRDLEQALFEQLIRQLARF